MLSCRAAVKESSISSLFSLILDLTYFIGRLSDMVEHFLNFFDLTFTPLAPLFCLQIPILHRLPRCQIFYVLSTNSCGLLPALRDAHQSTRRIHQASIDCSHPFDLCNTYIGTHHKNTHIQLQAPSSPSSQGGCFSLLSMVGCAQYCHVFL